MSTPMQRRDFITLLGGSAAAWPRAARAQQRPAMPVVGFLGSDLSPDRFASRVRSFRQGLTETGYVEGRNVVLELRRAADGEYDRLSGLAADLVRRQVAVIAAGSGVAARAAKAATATIPIVFYTAAAPVETGLVASLSRPGGNLTGATTLGVELAPKRLELLHELIPTAAIIALLVNPTNPVSAEVQTRNVQAAARVLGLQVHALHASSERDFDTVFETLAQLRAGGLVIGNVPLFGGRPDQLAALARRHAMPAIFGTREFTAAGGLMSYEGSVGDMFRLIGGYAGRILKGEKPADLPVQQATRIELIINMKTAKALGLTFPLTMLGRADEVIE